MNLDEHAVNLKHHLFGKDYTANLGVIGVGKNELHVYIFVSKKRWPGEMPSEYHGIPVKWHFGTNPVPL
ncbi:MAG TPA: hypothetical protein VEP90_13565 [Methylomirabilota bacterium]|nr:hypothetical protein [Methylomirabilota bacterium]